MKPEERVKKKVRAILDQYGAYHFNPIQGAYSTIGIKDIVACFRGRFIGIECKANGNKPTALQLKDAEAIRVKGTGIALVINQDNLQALIDVLERLKHER